ncbi:hypothetical protein AAG570_013965 [Ranatra chinensis]|uniref:C2H2-type domain-containing protein n=1 Tax=Ranatra chinensis TaxID=642074 RepID=A0ABD0YFL8_9HEMI
MSGTVATIGGERTAVLVAGLRQHLKYECGKEPPVPVLHKAKRRSTLAEHIKRDICVAASQRFVCLQCGRTYSYSQGLHRHLRYECGKEPQFQCPHCPHRSKQKESLNKHINEVHNPNPIFYFCNICPYKAKRRSIVKQHLVMVHRTLPHPAQLALPHSL